MINIHFHFISISFDNSNLSSSLADVESSFLFFFLFPSLFEKGEKREKRRGAVSHGYLIVSLIFNYNEKKGNVNASGKKRLISINRPAKAPNQSVLSTGATERYVLKSRIEKPPFLFYLL